MRMAGAGETVNAWLAAVREDLNSTKPKDEATDNEISRFFAKWSTPVHSTQDGAKSRMLDSTELESRYAVDRLTKKSDGTTVVRYYFSNDSTEANALSVGESVDSF
jgi:hypothetical protein